MVKLGMGLEEAMERRDVAKAVCGPTRGMEKREIARKEDRCGS